jgi:hypothetical protein
MSPVSTFSAIAYPFSGISAITRGNVCVRFKLSDGCPFSPDIACFHVFALRLAITRGKICVHVKLSDACPFSPDVARFHPSFSRFQAFSL